MQSRAALLAGRGGWPPPGRAMGPLSGWLPLGRLPPVCKAVPSRTQSGSRGGDSTSREQGRAQLRWRAAGFRARAQGRWRHFLGLAWDARALVVVVLPTPEGAGCWWCRPLLLWLSPPPALRQRPPSREWVRGAQGSDKALPAWEWADRFDMSWLSPEWNENAVHYAAQPIAVLLGDALCAASPTRR